VRGPLLLAALLAPLLLLGACGRVGPPRPPGPASEIIYPRLYPYVPRAAPGAARGTDPAAGAPIEQGDQPSSVNGGTSGTGALGGSPQSGPR